LESDPQMEIDVLCIGHASYDLVLSVDHHPGPDEKCFAQGLIGAGGGPAANAAVTVARLGGKTAFAGYLGFDHFGNLHLDELRSEGVLTDLVVRGNSPTPLSAILVKPEGTRTVIAYRAGMPVLDPEQVDFSHVHSKAILFDGHEPSISVPLAIEARGRNIVTVLDAGSVHTGTVRLVALCGNVIASEKFARDFCKEKDPLKAVRSIAAMCQVAVVTLGAGGLVWAAGEKSGEIPAFPVDAVDTTGAGDIFHGAFALRKAMGEDLPSALRYASAAAAIGCTRMGARPGIPRKQEVQEFLARFSESS
jgi:sulfofructose kinase